MKRLPWTLLLMLFASLAQAAYITDRIRVGLYAEPSTQNRPLKVLLSGEEIKLLEEKGNFIRVEINDGTQGWIGRQYLSEDEPAVRSLLASRKELARLQIELEQTRQELLALQQEVTSGNEDNILKEALAAANLKAKELEEKLAERLKLGTEGQPSCEQQLDEMEARQLQCQVRLAKHTAENKDPVVAENERLREVMQQAVSLLDVPRSGEVPVLIPASAFLTTQIISRPTPPSAAVPSPVVTEQASETPKEESLPVWIYLVLVLTLITGIIAGFALFDFRSRHRYNAHL